MISSSQRRNIFLLNRRSVLAFDWLRPIEPDYPQESRRKGPLRRAPPNHTVPPPPPASAAATAESRGARCRTKQRICYLHRAGCGTKRGSKRPFQKRSRSEFSQSPHACNTYSVRKAPRGEHRTRDPSVGSCGCACPCPRVRQASGGTVPRVRHRRLWGCTCSVKRI